MDLHPNNEPDHVLMVMMQHQVLIGAQVLLLTLMGDRERKASLGQSALDCSATCLEEIWLAAPVSRERGGMQNGWFQNPLQI